MAHIIVRLPKKFSSFFYFIFESNEGICHFSTLDESIGQEYRDIEIKSTIEFKEEVDRIIQVLGQKFPITIRQDTVILDQ